MTFEEWVAPYQAHRQLPDGRVLLVEYLHPGVSRLHVCNPLQLWTLDVW